jgi:phospholipid/cholesterol/gamma-HCH transport system substrate-binding protein
LDVLADEFKKISSGLDNTLTNLKPILSNFKTVSDSLKAMRLNQTLEKTQSALQGINETFAKLRKGDNTASKLLTEDTLYVNLNRLLTSLDSLAKHMNDYPDHFFAPLGKSHKKVMKDREKAEEERKAKTAQPKSNP